MTEEKAIKKRGRPAKVKSESTQTVVTAEKVHKPKSAFKLAEIATKKYRKILGRENAALDKATSKVRARFQNTKGEFLNGLEPEVLKLVLAELNLDSVPEVENPDVTDQDQEAEAE